ncbi:UNVERIFIED_ORG: hypothetical protein JN05_01491 [Zoogloea ramigera]
MVTPASSFLAASTALVTPPKGKTRQLYEFGVKVSIATTHKEGLVRLRRNWLQGADGDAFNVLLCGCGHYLRMILRKLRLFFAFIAASLTSLHFISKVCIALASLFHDIIGGDRPRPSLCLH